MLKKFFYLLKYEFNYYFRVLGPLYGALLLFSLASGVQTKLSGGNTSYLLSLLWGALFTAISVAGLMLVIRRFRSNILGAEGYLTLVLPVSIWTHVAGKAVAALCVSLLSSFVFAVSLFVNLKTSGSLTAFDSDAMNRIMLELGDKGAELAFTAAISVIVVFQQVCLFYALLTATSLLPKFRLGAAFLGYFIIMFFVQQPILRTIGGAEWMDNIFSMNFLLPLAVENIIFAALYFWVCGLLLKNTLNLE